VEKNPTPETYRALLQAQSELHRHNLNMGGGSRLVIRQAPVFVRSALFLWMVSGPGRGQIKPFIY
jgi:hypothetical protein